MWSRDTTESGRGDQVFELTPLLWRSLPEHKWELWSINATSLSEDNTESDIHVCEMMTCNSRVYQKHEKLQKPRKAAGFNVITGKTFDMSTLIICVKILCNRSTKHIALPGQVIEIVIASIKAYTLQWLHITTVTFFTMIIFSTTLSAHYTSMCIHHSSMQCLLRGTITNF